MEASNYLKAMLRKDIADIEAGHWHHWDANTDVILKLANHVKDQELASLANTHQALVDYLCRR